MKKMQLQKLTLAAIALFLTVSCSKEDVAEGSTSGFTHYVGELFGGGIVVSVWKTNGVEHGLIASLTDLKSTDLYLTYPNWTKPDFNLIMIGSGAQSDSDGFANTNAIVHQAGVGTDYAAGICKAYDAGGYTDWYLPAIDEIQQCRNSHQIINGILGEKNGFQDAFYWSSTELNYKLVWGQNLNNVYAISYLSKDSNAMVRAVRRF